MAIMAMSLILVHSDLNLLRLGVSLLRVCLLLIRLLRVLLLGILLVWLLRIGLVLGLGLVRLLIGLLVRLLVILTRTIDQRISIIACWFDHSIWLIKILYNISKLNLLISLNTTRLIMIRKVQNILF